MHPDWARSLRDQCQTAGVPFFFKQWGAWEPDPADGAAWSDSTGRVTFLTPENERTSGPAFGSRSTALRIVRKKSEHRELDGRTWDEFPAVTP
jgi:protein gp37